MVKSKKNKDVYFGTGRRKESVARVRLTPGKGTIIVNGQEVQAYFGGRAFFHRRLALPFKATGTEGKYDIIANIDGGGKSGQVGALVLGVSRALLQVDEGFRKNLKDAGLLTRDPREKERRKYGLKKARKAPQWSKR